MIRAALASIAAVAAATFAAAVTALAAATAAVTIASVVVVVTAIAVAAALLGRVRGVLLVRRVFRLIRALEPDALDGPDVGPHLCGEPLGVV